MIKKSYLTKVISITLALMVLLAGLSISMTAGAATMKYNIDFSKKASLTLYKYEMSDTSKTTHGGTGEKNDEQYIPAEAKRLPDVTFTIRKVAELYSYFKPDGVSLPTAAAAKAMAPIGDPVSKKTDANGVASFTALPLGIYYVEEVAGPSQITKKIEPFVLSLPITNASGTEWLYDVHSYPKNQTSYSNIKILKKDLPPVRRWLMQNSDRRRAPTAAPTSPESLPSNPAATARLRLPPSTPTNSTVW